MAIGSGGERLEGHLLIDAASRGRRRVGLAEVRLKPGVPVVAVGGPVKVYHPEAARRLGCEIIFPDHWAVANAVGAASGVVARTVTIAITGDGAGSFRVHLPEGVMPMTTAREALALAEAEARRLAGAAALAMGATMVEVSVRRDLKLLPDAIDDNGLFDGQVTAEAIGRPLGGNLALGLELERSAGIAAGCAIDEMHMIVAHRRGTGQVISASF